MSTLAYLPLTVLGLLCLPESRSSACRIAFQKSMVQVVLPRAPLPPPPHTLVSEPAHSETFPRMVGGGGPKGFFMVPLLKSKRDFSGASIISWRRIGGSNTSLFQTRIHVESFHLSIGVPLWCFGGILIKLGYTSSFFIRSCVQSVS